MLIGADHGDPIKKGYKSMVTLCMASKVKYVKYGEYGISHRRHQWTTVDVLECQFRTEGIQQATGARTFRKPQKINIK